MHIMLLSAIQFALRDGACADDLITSRLVSVALSRVGEITVHANSEWAPVLYRGDCTCLAKEAPKEVDDLVGDLYAASAGNGRYVQQAVNDMLRHVEFWAEDRVRVARVTELFQQLDPALLARQIAPPLLAATRVDVPGRAAFADRVIAHMLNSGAHADACARIKKMAEVSGTWASSAPCSHLAEAQKRLTRIIGPESGIRVADMHMITKFDRELAEQSPSCLLFVSTADVRAVASRLVEGV